jgi:SAM-dependent methyltransferase
MHDSDITKFKDYQYKRNSNGSYHRILDESTYLTLREYYSTHIDIGGRFRDASILTYSDFILNSLAKSELRKANQWLDEFAYFGIPRNRELRLLELGCGCGAFLLLFENESFGISEGIDISTLAVAVTARLWPKTLNIIVGEIIDTLSKSSEKFGLYDIVTAFDIIEHIWDLEATARLIHILLKPHGLCVVEVPVISPFWTWEQVTHFRLFHPKHHLHLFTPSGISKLFREANFTIKHATLSNHKSKYFMVFEK